MAGFDFTTTYPDTAIPRRLVKNYLDQPAAEFLVDTTIDQILIRSHDTVFNQTTIDVGNLNQVKHVIEAITVWHSFGAYMNSMPEQVQETNKFEFMNKLRYYKNVAIGLGNLLGIDISGEKIKLDTTTIIAAGTGISNLKDTEHFTGAHDNVV